MPSDVWSFFIKCPNDVSKAICSVCSKKISRGGSNSREFTPTNLRAHLQKEHPFQYNEFKNKNNLTPERKKQKARNHTSSESSDAAEPDENTNDFSKNTTSFIDQPKNDLQTSKPKVQQTLKNMIKRSVPLSYNSNRALQITDLIAKMIAGDLLPFQHVEKEGFVKLIQFLEPRYNIPHRTTFSRTIIPEMYNKTKIKVIEVLKMGSNYSFTTDLWSSNTNNDYISITCHFVDTSFIRHNIILEVQPFRPNCHTGAEIYEFIVESLETWGIELNNIHVFLRDNAFNMESAFAHRQFFTSPCNAHTLQLVVDDVLNKQKEHQQLCKKARSIVGHFKHSIKANKLLRQFQKQNKIPEHKLLQDVPTRWNSTYLMFKRLLEQKKSIVGLSPFISLNVTLLTVEWETIEKLVQILEIFYTATLNLSKENATISEVIPLIRSIKANLENTNSPSSIASKLLSSIEKRYDGFESNKLFSISTLLDPRFKDKVFSCDMYVQTAKEELKKELNNIYTSESFDVGNTHTQTESPSIQNKIFSTSIYNLILPQVETGDEINTEEKEMSNYFEENIIDCNEDIFHYWFKSKFKGLKVLAQKYHSCPPGSVASERAFSTAGLVCTNSRNALNPEKVQQLIFLHKNLKYLS